MALTANRVTDGFEPVYNKLMGSVPNPVKYLLTPGITFLRGDAVVLSAGKIAKAAANGVNILGVMAETVLAAANVAATTTYGYVYDNPFNVYRCTFSGHRDGTATSGTTTTLVDTGLATSTDSVWNGALLYVYEGPGAGSIRTVKAYTGTTDTLTVEEAFTEAITSASKYVLLGAAAAAGDVINVGSVGINLVDENTISAGGTIATEAGPMAVLAINVRELMMDVVFRKHLFNTP